MSINTLTIAASTVTMTSLELVEFINDERKEGEAVLRHDNFMAKVEKHPGIDSPKFLGQYRDSTGRKLKCYHLPKREAELMVMSESLAVQTRVYDRLRELEAKAAQPKPIALPQNYIEALEHLLDAKRCEQAAIARCNHAVRTKAEIGSRREATAMATASAAKRESDKLRDQLGFNTRHATVIAVEKALKSKFGKQDWRKLKAWCVRNGVASAKVHDPRWGEANAWPAGAWLDVYGVERITTVTQSSNKRALAWDLAYGFTEEGRMVGAAHDGSDSVYLVLWKKDCRWLNLKSTPTAAYSGTTPTPAV